MVGVEEEPAGQGGPEAEPPEMLRHAGKPVAVELGRCAKR